jgi:large subunit ribosomal protein L9
MKEILLRETIEHLGHRGEVVKVAAGYARNYLLPPNLALPVTTSNQRQVERERAASAAREAEERVAALALASRIEAVHCVMARRVGETETLYGSVTSSDLSEYLSSQQIEIDRRKIALGDPIKVLGESMVPIKLHRSVTAKLKVSVIREATDGADDEAISGG